MAVRAFHLVGRTRALAATGMIVAMLLSSMLTADHAPAATNASATDAGQLATTPAIPALDRDCGFSVRLSDGNVLWVFCDSYYTSNTGKLHATQSNTAALAGASSKTVVRDWVYSFYGEGVLNADATFWGGRSFITLPSSPTSFPCTNGVRKAWPRGAVDVPKAGAAGADRVLVYYSRVCDSSATNGELSFTQNGIGLASYDYAPGSFDPAKGPAKPTVATIVNDNLFPASSPIGSGAHLGSDGFVYAYACSSTCVAARVAPANAGNAAAYQQWNGAVWGATSVAMVMPGTSIPTSEATVQWVASIQKYVMTYSECGVACTLPVYDRVALRTAAQPMGPWSSATEVLLPGCAASWSATSCYAAVSHVELSSTTLGVTWMRRGDGSAPSGRLHWGTIPFSAFTSSSVV